MSQFQENADSFSENDEMFQISDHPTNSQILLLDFDSFKVKCAWVNQQGIYSRNEMISFRDLPLFNVYKTFISKCPNATFDSTILNLISPQINPTERNAPVHEEIIDGVDTSCDSLDINPQFSWKDEIRIMNGLEFLTDIHEIQSLYEYLFQQMEKLYNIKILGQEGLWNIMISPVFVEFPDSSPRKTIDLHKKVLSRLGFRKFYGGTHSAFGILYLSNLFLEKMTLPLTATCVAIDGHRIRTLCIATDAIPESFHVQDCGFDPLIEKTPNPEFISKLVFQLIQSLIDAEKLIPQAQFVSFLNCILVYCDWSNFSMQDLNSSILTSIKTSLEIGLQIAFPKYKDHIAINIEPKIIWCGLEGMKMLLPNPFEKQRVVIFETLGSQFVAY